MTTWLYPWPQTMPQHPCSSRCPNTIPSALCPVSCTTAGPPCPAQGPWAHPLCYGHPSPTIIHPLSRSVSSCCGCPEATRAIPEQRGWVHIPWHRAAQTRRVSVLVGLLTVAQQNAKSSTTVCTAVGFCIYMKLGSLRHLPLWQHL